MMCNRKIRSDEKGAVLILVVGALVVLIGCAALAIDVGQMYIAKQRAQDNCDAAALAGVIDLALHTDDVPLGKSMAYTSAENAVSGNNEVVGSWTLEESLIEFPAGTLLYDDGVTSVDVDEGEAIRVSGHADVGFVFAQVFGQTSQQVPASATAIVLYSKGGTNNLYIPLSVSDTTILGDGTPEHEPAEFGERIALKVSSWQDGYLGSGNTGAVRLAEGESGTDDFRTRVSGDADPVTVSYEEELWIDTEPGDFGNPTVLAFKKRFDKETNPKYISPEMDDYAWDNWVNSYDSTTQMFDFTWRLVIIPIIEDPDGPVTGRESVHVVGLAGFFIEKVEKIGNESTIYGRFVEGLMLGGEIRWVFPSGDNPEQPNTMLAIRLIS